MNNICAFSPDRAHRYTLIHNIDRGIVNNFKAGRRPIVWIGLNPSTADENQLDPTLTRIRNFSAGWGYSSFVMLNLFGFRATDPRDMKRADDPIGAENDLWLKLWGQKAHRVVAAWGTHGVYRGRDRQVKELLSSVGVQLWCLDVSKGGHPKHPLYLKSSLTLKPYTNP